MGGDRIIVIAASTGGVMALLELTSLLPSDLNAPVLVVQHLSPTARSYLHKILGRHTTLPVVQAQDAALLERGTIYIAPPDWHMMVEEGRIRLTRGPKENHTRPAADVLFRSAAVAYGPRAIAVVLTGQLDNGVAGLAAVKQQGGTTIVQDPEEAPARSMPATALAHVAVDYCLRIRDMPGVLAMLARDDPQSGSPSARDWELLRAENEIARNNSPVAQLGAATDIACPECGAPLRVMPDHSLPRYRCGMGHAYSGKTLLAELALSREAVLWQAIRAISNQAQVAIQLAEDAAAKQTEEADFLRGLARDLDVQSRHVRRALGLVTELIEPTQSADPGVGD